MSQWEFIIPGFTKVDFSLKRLINEIYSCLSAVAEGESFLSLDLAIK